ncbi:MAG: enoyl-CoA hydratase-related protein, partial [Gammaproteobacteria bacterium]
HVRLASEAARFGQPEVKLGLAPGYGGTQRRPRLVGRGRALQLILTGEMIDAAEGYRLGAIEKVVPREQLREAARDIARKIAAKSPAMIRLAKEALTNIEDGDLEHKYRTEQGLTLEAYTTRDSQEARDAFVQKRDASF